MIKLNPPIYGMPSTMVLQWHTGKRWSEIEAQVSIETDGCRLPIVEVESSIWSAAPKPSK